MFAAKKAVTIQAGRAFASRGGTSAASTTNNRLRLRSSGESVVALPIPSTWSSTRTRCILLRDRPADRPNRRDIWAVACSPPPVEARGSPRNLRPPGHPGTYEPVERYMEMRLLLALALVLAACGGSVGSP